MHCGCRRTHGAATAQKRIGQHTRGPANGDHSPSRVAPPSNTGRPPPAAPQSTRSSWAAISRSLYTYTNARLPSFRFSLSVYRSLPAFTTSSRPPSPLLSPPQPLPSVDLVLLPTIAGKSAATKCTNRHFLGSVNIALYTLGKNLLKKNSINDQLHFLSVLNIFICCLEDIFVDCS